MEPNWLKWAKQLAALAQNGLTYSDNVYEIERYEQIRRIAAEMMSAGFELDAKTFLELFPREKGYETPKVDVRGVVFRDEKILLVREKLDGGWTLPGGWADPCQTPSEAVVREVFEESGFEARVVKLAAVYDRSKHPHSPSCPSTSISSSSSARSPAAPPPRATKPPASSSSPRPKSPSNSPFRGRSPSSSPACSSTTATPPCPRISTDG